MKKLSRILALVLSLMMALTCCTFAEEAAADSTLYTLSVFDPIVYSDDTPMLDLTGATLDLNFAATDTGLLGLIVNLFAGENLDYVTGATAQLDPTGVTAWLDGMSNVYNVDVSMLAGVNPYFFMSAVPLRTTLNTLDFSALQGVEFTPVMRVLMIQELFAPIAGEPDGNTYPLSITAEEGRAMLESLPLMIAEVDAEAAAELKEELDADPAATFTLEGTMVYDAAGITVDAAGTLVDASNDLTFSLKYSDDMANILLDGTIKNAEGETVASLTGSGSPADGRFALAIDSDLTAELTYASTPDADGRSTTNVQFSCSEYDETLFSLAYTGAPVAGSAQVDHSIVMSVPEEEANVEIIVQTGTHPEGVGFNFGVSASEDEESYNFGLQYTGDNYVDETGYPYHVGGLYLYAADNYQNYALDLGLMMQKMDTPSAAWVLPTEGAIDILNMDETQQQTAMDEAMAVLQGALPTLTAGVPGLAPLMGGMMG